MMNLKGVIISLAVLAVINCINAHQHININRTVHQVHSGTFSFWSFCPNGGKAISFRNYYNPDTSVTGIRLKCDTTDQMPYYITSDADRSFEKTQESLDNCTQGFDGIQVKNEPAVGIQEVRFTCGAETVGIPPPAGYVETSSWESADRCSVGQTICGIRTALDSATKNLKGIQFICCYAASSNESRSTDTLGTGAGSETCDFETDMCNWTTPAYSIPSELIGGYPQQNMTVYVRASDIATQTTSQSGPSEGVEGTSSSFVFYESYVDRFLSITNTTPRTFTSPLYNGTLWQDTEFDFYFHAYGLYLGDFHFEVYDNVTSTVIQRQVLFSRNEPDFITDSNETNWYHVRFPIGLHLGGHNSEFVLRFVANADWYAQWQRDRQSSDFGVDMFQLNYTSAFTCDNPGCHENATCALNGGELDGINCTCKYGFVGSGDNVVDGCLPNNPCTLDNATCLQNYSQNSCDYVSPGYHNCSCGVGFELSSDNTTCVDIDECPTVTCGNNATCINTMGNFTCQCDPGFTWDNTTGPENLTCGLDGGWTAWALPGDVFSCSVSCGGGIYNATRNCTDPTPIAPGSDCDGDSYNATAECNTQECPTSCPVWKNCTCSGFTTLYEGGSLDMSLTYFNGLSSGDLTFAMTKLSQWNQTVVDKVCTDAACDVAALNSSIGSITMDLGNITSLVDATTTAKIEMRHILDCNPANTSSHNEWLWDIFDKLCEYEAFLPNIQEDMSIKVDLLVAERDRCAGRSNMRSLLELMYRKW